MSETLQDALGRLHSLVEELGVGVALIGGMAIIARVRARATEDIDVLLAYDTADLDALLAAVERHGYGYDPADRELFEAGLIRMWGPPDRDAGIGVDLLAADSPFVRDVIARATPVELGVVTFPCAQLEDLVLMKLEANRPIDIDDVIAIEDAFADDLDRSYLRATATRLGLAERLELYFA